MNSGNTSWEQSLYTFLKPWKKRNEVIGALVSGSYVFGTATPLSDIDIHIILSDTEDWRERGNKIVDGFLIEYFANPVKQLKKYMEDDYKNNRRTDSRMFLFGKVIFDKTGDIKLLISHAKKMFSKDFKELEHEQIELLKYEIWDLHDSLKDLEQAKSPIFSYVYYLLLDKIIAMYTKFKQSEVGVSHKLYRRLTDKKFREKYRIDLIPDGKFNNLLLASIKKTLFINIEKLLKYVFSQMGGFSIDGWKIRTPVENK